MSVAEKDKEIKVKPKDNINNQPTPLLTEAASNLFKTESDNITYKNMSKLTKQDAFKIGDKTYNRRRLKPKELLEFVKAYTEVTQIPDLEIEKKLDLMEKSALIALEDFTKEDFENCDSLMLEQVLGACFLITRGFREVRD